MNSIRLILTVFVGIFCYSSHCFAKPAPDQADAEKRLTVISGVNADENSICLAYQQDNLNIITSKQCVDRILQASSDQQSLQLTTGTGERLAIAQQQIKANKGIYRLTFKLGILKDIPYNPEPYFKPTDHDPIQIIAKIWHPVSGHHGVFTFQSVNISMVMDSQPVYKPLQPHPELTPGSLFFYEDKLLCILSEDDGKCIPHQQGTKKKPALPKHNGTQSRPDYPVVNGTCTLYCEDNKECLSYAKSISCSSGATCSFFPDSVSCDQGACGILACNSMCLGPKGNMKCFNDYTPLLMKLFAGATTGLVLYNALWYIETRYFPSACK